jgi:hypothetical protein
MSTAASANVAILECSTGARTERPEGSPGSALAEFEHTYRTNVDVVMAYFARRCAEPQTVADLTSETFVRAASAFGGFDPGRGSARAWLFVSSVPGRPGNGSNRRIRGNKASRGLRQASR